MTIQGYHISRSGDPVRAYLLWGVLFWRHGARNVALGWWSWRHGGEALYRYGHFGNSTDSTRVDGFVLPSLVWLSGQGPDLADSGLRAITVGARKYDQHTFNAAPGLPRTPIAQDKHPDRYPGQVMAARTPSTRVESSNSKMAHIRVKASPPVTARTTSPGSTFRAGRDARKRTPHNK